jgi:hypothetical protein
MLVIGDRLAYLVHSKHTVFCNLPNVLAAISESHPSVCLMMQLKNIINLSSCRIGIHLSAEDYIDGGVPG